MDNLRFSSLLTLLAIIINDSTKLFWWNLYVPSSVLGIHLLISVSKPPVKAVVCETGSEPLSDLLKVIQPGSGRAWRWVTSSWAEETEKKKTVLPVNFTVHTCMRGQEAIQQRNLWNSLSLAFPKLNTKRFFRWAWWKWNTLGKTLAYMPG